MTAKIEFIELPFNQSNFENHCSENKSVIKSVAKNPEMALKLDSSPDKSGSE